MKTVKIKLDFGSFPVWTYAEEGSLINNDLPEYLYNDKELNTSFESIQREYESLFTNNEKEFKYNGFNSPDSEKSFNRTLELAKEKLISKLNDDFKFVE